MVSELEGAADLCQEVMSGMTFGIAVMTLVDTDGQPHGMTISSLAPLSADPPTVLMRIGQAASSRPFLVPGRRLCANVLAADQVPQSMGFAFGSEDPFEAFDWEPTADGTPVLVGTAAHLLCEVERVVDHHDVSVVFASVIGGSLDKDESLIYRRKTYYRGLLPVEPGATGNW